MYPNYLSDLLIFSFQHHHYDEAGVTVWQGAGLLVYGQTPAKVMALCDFVWEVFAEYYQIFPCCILTFDDIWCLNFDLSLAAKLRHLVPLL